eukprot:scaffold259414_cov20-Tisochrysis_lutea.AAC.1
MIATCLIASHIGVSAEKQLSLSSKCFVFLVRTLWWNNDCSVISLPATVDVFGVDSPAVTGNPERISSALADIGVETEKQDPELRTEMAYGMFDTRGKVSAWTAANRVLIVDSSLDEGNVTMLVRCSLRSLAKQIYINVPAPPWIVWVLHVHMAMYSCISWVEYRECLSCTGTLLCNAPSLKAGHQHKGKPQVKGAIASKDKCADKVDHQHSGWMQISGRMQ